MFAERYIDERFIKTVELHLRKMLFAADRMVFMTFRMVFYTLQEHEGKWNNL